MGESVAWHLLFLIFKREVDRVSDKVAPVAWRFVRSITTLFPFTPERDELGIYMDAQDGHGSFRAYSIHGTLT